MMNSRNGSTKCTHHLTIISLATGQLADEKNSKLGDCQMVVQWEFQDPEMEVLYHIRPYFVGIFPYIGLKNRPYIC